MRIIERKNEGEVVESLVELKKKKKSFEIKYNVDVIKK
jgi:hypothetical protein